MGLVAGFNVIRVAAARGRDILREEDYRRLSLRLGDDTFGVGRAR